MSSTVNGSVPGVRGQSRSSRNAAQESGESQNNAPRVGRDVGVGRYGTALSWCRMSAGVGCLPVSVGVARR